MKDENLLESSENQKRGKRNSLFALIWHTILLNPPHDRRSQCGVKKNRLAISGVPEARYYRVLVLKRGCLQEGYKNICSVHNS